MISSVADGDLAGALAIWSGAQGQLYFSFSTGGARSFVMARMRTRSNRPVRNVTINQSDKENVYEDPIHQ